MSFAPANIANIADFIKRLYRMLEDRSYAHIVSWGITGDTFVVHEPKEFSKSILPQHFKHNKMASFVRQLNKYDFHKIKTNDEESRLYNDQAWEFQHPNFQHNRNNLIRNPNPTITSNTIFTNTDTTNNNHNHNNNNNNQLINSTESTSHSHNQFSEQLPTTNTTKPLLPTIITESIDGDDVGGGRRNGIISKDNDNSRNDNAFYNARTL
ncbi:10279_t:CDS:2 [Entrophospora sp. SA101]|nr:10279_t:CDS:2 [Entrophospora sp. SA101]CAJ0863203.1 11211_t:CDS:2 [Entrophospora sp. SA101]